MEWIDENKAIALTLYFETRTKLEAKLLARRIFSQKDPLAYCKGMRCWWAKGPIWRSQVQEDPTELHRDPAFIPYCYSLVYTKEFIFPSKR